MKPASRHWWFPVVVGVLIALGAAQAFKRIEQQSGRSFVGEHLANDLGAQTQAVEAVLEIQFKLLSSIKPYCPKEKAGRAEDELIPQLELIRQNSQFVTVLATDRDANLIAGAPLVNADGVPYFWRNRDVADREYFVVPSQTGKPYLGNAFLGRGFGRDQLVAFSVPYFCLDGFAGVFEGSMTLEHLAKLFAEMPKHEHTRLLLVDSLDQVLWQSEELPFHPMQSLAGSELALDYTLAIEGTGFETMVKTGEPIQWAVWAPIRSTWKLVGMAPIAELSSNALRIQMLIWAMSLGLGGLAMWMMREFLGSG